ncbi:hypothetical protein ACFP1Z_13755 [Streptomyces gamaensis]|uniref:AMIN-like domain-containing protein n=1 Tax=Streptomyces gamaensis TaxID=1763542 RepID=A0ABW0Z0V0_9ACTN
MRHTSRHSGRRTGRRAVTALAALVLAGGGLTATAGTSAAADAAGSSCAAVGWGSRERVSTDTEYHPLTDIRTDRHACFDRIVFDVHTTEGHPIGYRVGYVDKVHQDGSGDVVPVGGGAVLAIRVAAPSHDVASNSTRYPGKLGKPLPGVDLTGYRTFRDARFAGSFEGDTQVGLGVRARLPFRVFQSDNHIVVDVAHSWDGLR